VDAGCLDKEEREEEEEEDGEVNQTDKIAANKAARSMAARGLVGEPVPCAGAGVGVEKEVGAGKGATPGMSGGQQERWEATLRKSEENPPNRVDDTGGAGDGWREPSSGKLGMDVLHWARRDGVTRGVEDEDDDEDEEEKEDEEEFKKEREDAEE
jgi:hypothetical protein